MRVPERCMNARGAHARIRSILAGRYGKRSVRLALPQPTRSHLVRELHLNRRVAVCPGKRTRACRCCFPSGSVPNQRSWLQQVLSPQRESPLAAAPPGDLVCQAQSSVPSSPCRRPQDSCAMLATVVETLYREHHCDPSKPVSTIRVAPLPAATYVKAGLSDRGHRQAIVGA